EDELFMCAPSLYGFSFTAKKWGEVNIDYLNEISFDDDAFDQLVMDPIKKDLISSLVMSKHKGVDLISGKGGGCIFLLHGPPGVGKTLTAEAISEYLHRPLYNVSVGELGTSVVELESKLSEILEVASIWNAVILIDEADIFLERRSENNIYRNALVSVFLRLLEYHQGILFLTTNRVKCFDAAFQSRVSISLKYNDL
ncbi:P-loop containing nucleoside triphosphate hydrolase protein, partial [Rhizophagus irregularis]